MVLKNTLVWTVAVVGISTLLGFILAILLNNEFKGRKLARAVVVFPWATTLIVQASIWKFIIDTALWFLLRSNISSDMQNPFYICDAVLHPSGYI